MCTCRERNIKRREDVPKAFSFNMPVSSVLSSLWWLSLLSLQWTDHVQWGSHHDTAEHSDDFSPTEQMEPADANYIPKLIFEKKQKWPFILKQMRTNYLPAH